MDITYSILLDATSTERGDILDSFLHPKSKALRLLKKHRTRNPLAYLVKCVQTRCMEKKG